MKGYLPLAAAVLFVFFGTIFGDGHGEGLECPDGWILEWGKCYKIYYGENKRTYTRAREMCESYGSRLVTIKDQLEHDLIGEKVSEVAGENESFYIGLSKEKADACDTCTELRWSDGKEATEYQGFWADDEPDDSDGGCVFSRKNMEDYVYDRPYTMNFDNCLVVRSFVCEKMPAPEDSFHCFGEGYTNENNQCDGKSDCKDGSDEWNCPDKCHYYHTGENGDLGRLIYNNSVTCTWAIETPPGTNAYVQFNNFYTEYQADFVTIYIGSMSETESVRLDRISGNMGTRAYRSYNNFILVKFTSDSSINNTGQIIGFTGTFTALKVNSGHEITLIAVDEPNRYNLSTFDVASTNSFLGQKDYIIVIETENQYQFGQMITLEIEDLQINDGDSVMFFDGGSEGKMLTSNCNNEDDCDNYKLVYSTGKKLSIVLRTQKTVSNNVVFRFKYRQGCYYETSDPWGTIFTPGYTGKINYPNYVKCTWNITVNEPIAIYFDPNSRLQSVDHNRVVNGDFLKIYENGVMVGTPGVGLSSSDIQGQVFTLTGGSYMLELESSVTRSARGFLATWSTACMNPNYDENTIVSPSPAKWHYRATMRLSCKQGYDFHQEQIPDNTAVVTVECGFKGIWKNYLQIPRCTPKYCGDVPNINNGYIVSSTGSVFGSKATYKCNTGSAPIGSLEITCGQNGGWSSLPTCSAARCPSNRISETIVNGKGTRMSGDGTSIGTVYEYECDAGYEFVGEPYVYCQDDATWSQNSAPSCQRLTCLLPSLDNGVYIPAGRIVTGGSAAASCSSGYQVGPGPVSIECSSERQLSTPPLCIDVNECESPGTCQHSCHNTVGSYYCTCDDGYFLGSNGRSCLDIDECNLNTDNCDGGCFNTQGSYTCSCSPPYVLYSGDMTSGYRIPTTAGERGDLPTDTYHVNHTCVLVQCDSPAPTINNGQLLTKRLYHRYGDSVEYQCDIGYTPLRTILTCGRSGTWDRNPPTCSAAVCNTESPGFFQNQPTYRAGPYTYGQRLTLECDVAGQKFNKYRFCTYNKGTNSYEMQGSSYDCGVVDCGTPTQEPGSNYGVVTSTLFGSSFTFTCESNQPDGKSNDVSENTVRCLQDGYWDFGSLQCTALSCLDPGYPAGGDIIATSFADKSTVRFRCLQNGYSLSSNVTLTCSGTNFISDGVPMPTCIDTQKPVINNCPSNPISIRKYDLLQQRLPQLTVTDNTGIRSFTMSPRNANTTLYVSSDLTVTYTVTDYAGNQDVCTVQVVVEDEVPPTVTCPPVRIVELETDSSTEQYIYLKEDDVIPANQLASIKTFRVIGEPDLPGIMRITDLYKTFTYTVQVTDQADNFASCQGEVFVRPKACSELSFPTPLDADKNCVDTFNGGLRCTLTCRDSYTFDDSKSKTVTCTVTSGIGTWDTDWIPACVRDRSAPVVRCPDSVQIGQLSRKEDEYEFDFTTLRSSVFITDLNTYGSPVFSPERYTFGASDLYKPKVVTVTVTDSAFNRGTCSFQYTAVPPVCSELSLPTPQFGSIAGTRRAATVLRSAGWDVTITCTAGKILRNVGVSRTVSCDDNSAWSDDAIFPVCIDDTTPPVLVCPRSTVEKISTGDQQREITFAGNSNYPHTETDYSDIASVRFVPEILLVRQDILNTAQSIQMIAVDTAGNSAQCTFDVLVAAEECSPLALPAPVNGLKTCQQVQNGYTCTVSCNANYHFYGTTATEVSLTCQNGGQFPQYIPDCARDDDVRDKQFIATLSYQYVPADDAIVSVPPSCISYYTDTLKQSAVFTEMSSRLLTSCNSVFGPFPGLELTFLPDNTDGSVQNRQVNMFFAYTMSYTDPNVYYTCTNSFDGDIGEPQNSLSLSRNIDGNNDCPELKWNNFARVAGNGSFCVAPFFESRTNVNQCVRCPAGTQSNGVVCSVCPIGTYRTYGQSSCQLCGNGYTTRYPGATSSTQCVAPCGAGQVSPTGFSPCYSCRVGAYKFSDTQCLSCNSGLTTSSRGASSIAACVVSSSINDEPCTIGTQDVGNNQCEPCAVGTYRSINTPTCIPCPNSQTSTYVRGSYSSSQCLAKCSAGYTSDTGLAPCKPCLKGRYAVNTTTCETCPTDYTTITDGSTSCIETSSLRLNCPRGTSRDINTGECVKCAEGTYSSAEESFCVSCSDSLTTFFRGATAPTMCRSQCPSGFYSDTGRAPCTPCGFGKYSNGPGAKACTPCSSNNDMTTATTTSTSASQCIAKCDEGYFSYNGYNQNNACRPCPRNYYQSLKGQTECIQCVSSTSFSETPGLTTSTGCLSASSKCNNYCQNGGACSIRDNEPVCDCVEGQFHGPDCSIPVDHCASSPCYNGGRCTNTVSSFQCDCGAVATGPRCEEIVKTCDTSQASATCQNGGHCINILGGTRCMCTEGFSEVDCGQKRDICDPNPCNETGSTGCRDVSHNKGLRFRCDCRAGFTGVLCNEDINECDSNPCINGGMCRNRQNAFTCDCPNGYGGTYCETRLNTCTRINCQQFDSQATCVDVHSRDEPTCICNPGYPYDNDGYAQYEIRLNRAPDNLATFTPQAATTVAGCRERCTTLGANCDKFAFNTADNTCFVWSPSVQLSIISYADVNMYTKNVIYPDDDFYTPRYNLNQPTPFDQSDRELLSTLNNYGLNICAGTVPLFTRCCQVGETCLDNEALPSGVCSASGLNYPNTVTDYDVQFKCSVNRVFQNNVCVRKTDHYCDPNPCVNSIRCTSIFGGYTCTCMNGYTGKNCQTNINECANNPCLNDGTCVDAVGGYTCSCTDFYEGSNCQNPKNFCNLGSCSGRGTCRNTGVGYECTCPPAYDGTDCENEIDFCKSDPCIHGGTCQKRLGGYRCECDPGWQGTNCEAPVKHCELTTGRQCLGDCYNIFNNYTCNCEANTFGPNCENKPDPCGDYDKCQNNAVCSYDGTMKCSCPGKYTGDGCHILIDYCGKTNPCENDATCSVTSNGYQCACKPGYTGVRCDTEINECLANNVPCPGGGQCFDALNQYYCRCPIQKIGTDCLKDVDVNYDLYFNHPQGYGFAWIPYPTRVENANFVSVSLWVRYSVNDGTGVYMTQFIGDSLHDAAKFMEFEEKGVKVYVPMDTGNFIQLEYDRTAKVNDGNWRLVTILYDMANGTIKLYLNTIWHDTKTHTDLIKPAANFSMFVVLGCEFINEEQRCSERGNGFHGYLSQVNWYKRELFFDFDERREGDIPKIYRLPQHVFDAPGERMYLILVWNEYIYENGVGRMTPSEAKGDLCSMVSRNPPCSSYSQTTLLPSVTNCPDDMVVYSKDRIVSVTWDEPKFLNLGTGNVIKPSRLPGSSFTWGVYRNTYIGVDGGNNKAYCQFTIYVNAAECELPPNPYRGTQTCDTVSGRKGCMIQCNNQNPNMYMIDRSHPELFTCGHSGWWNQKKPFRPFRYPSCGLIKATIPRVKVYMRLSYEVITSAHESVERNIRRRTNEEFIKLNNDFNQIFCQASDCSDVILDFTITLVNRKRKRRQTPNSLSIALLEITLPSIEARTQIDSEDSSSEDVLIYFLLGQQILKFDTIPGLNFLAQNFEIVSTQICPVGEVLRNGQCVECGPGNYFRYTDSTNTTAICDDCPLRTYQDEHRAMSCKPCGDGLTTQMTGEYEQNSCKKSCPIGEYFNLDAGDCSKCDIGFYQDQVGQFRCKGCPAGRVTKEMGSISFANCSVSCDSGYELNNNGQCDPCKIGQYRDASTGVTQTCVSCPTGYITAKTATKTRAECSIIECYPGNYRDANSNTCEPCPLHQYQPEKWQTSCIPCGDPSRWRTESEGTISQSSCKYFCPSGYQVKQDPINSCDICPIGTYKDNNINIQGSCETCPGNKRSENEGAVSATDCTIYKCPVGNRPNIANTDCVKCPLGEYQDVEYSKDCKKCDPGYSTRQVESTSKDQCERYCPSGEEKINGICKPCIKGYYKNNADGLFESCQQCDSRFTTAGTGSTTVGECNIRTCPPGTKRNAGDTGCESCPRGTYQPAAFQKDCIPCEGKTDTRSVNSTAITDCETYCDSGYEKTSSGCVGCQIGYYKDNNLGNFTTCTLCPVEFITEFNYTDSAALCNVGNCSAGQYLKPDRKCERCPVGQYQPFTWQKECIPCGKDKTTENEGSDKASDCILECSPGFEDIGGECKMCPRGYYKINFAAASCTRCPIGLTTETIGATDPASCNLPACTAGEFLDRNTNPLECRPCGYDTYQDEVWQEECKPCLNQKVTLSIGNDELSDCVLDCGSGTEYNTTSGQCVLCRRGYYRNRIDRQQTQCRLCPLDKITIGEGGKDLSECTIANCTTDGYYRETTTNTCTKCPIGTYNSEDWVTSCRNCPQGNSTKFTGSDKIDDCISICPLGQFVGTNNRCELCRVGTYRSNMADDTCTQCPNGLLTPQAGADSQSQCSVSPCAAGQRYSDTYRCVDCEIGSYQPNSGSFQCIECPFAIKYTSRVGATSVASCRSPCNAGQQFNAATRACVPCPSGTFQPEAFQFTCMQCPLGRKFTSATGSQRIEDCLSYCSATAANDCSSNATCSVSDASSVGYTCTCFTNYESVGQVSGRECVHKCDLNYCKNGATCTREPSPSCACSKWYKGDFCQIRVKAEELSDDTLNIIIPVAIAAGGLILFLIILAVCCLCWRRGHAVNGGQTQYSEFQGERVDKASLHSYPIEYSMPYGSRPPSRLMMLAPGPDIVYENPAYTKDHSVIDGSVLEPAVYEA